MSLNETDDNGAIRLGVLLPFNYTWPFSINLVGPAINIAMEKVNNNKSYDFRMQIQTVRDTEGCGADLALVVGPIASVEMYHIERVQVLFGPVCDYGVAPVARWTPVWDIPLITAGGQSSFLGEKKKQYRRLTRVGNTYSKLVDFLLKTFLWFGWNNYGLLYHQNIVDNNALGVSNCYFCMRDVKRYLKIKDDFGNYMDKPKLKFERTFDEKYNHESKAIYQNRLLRAANKTRGKQTYLFYFTLSRSNYHLYCKKKELFCILIHT
jgi:hypothetical protein